MAAAISIGITLFVLLITQRFSGLDTPDSSFYASLSIFGSEVTDRAPIDSYFWTRLGYIAPVRGLTLLLEPMLGLFAYKALLLLALVISSYLMLRRHARWLVATFLTVIVASSSVILSYLGNPYLTGSVLAGTAVLIALATQQEPLTKKHAALAGMVLGWLVMVNPPGFLLAATIWVTLVIHASLAGTRSLRGLPMPLITAAFTAILTWGVFLGLGAWIFPGLNWFDAVTRSSQITLSNFASTSLVWLGDISLLVPLAALVTVFLSWIAHRRSAPAQQALVLSLTSVSFMLVFSPLMGGIALEAPLYQSMLWPPALMAFTLTATQWFPKDLGIARAWQILIIILGISLVIASGFIDPDLSFAGGAFVMILVTALVTVLPRTSLAIILSISAWAAGAQLTQNSRDDLGLYYLSPYNWAYASNPIETKLRTAVNVQEWLLANTENSDKILVWVDGPWTQGDRELYVAAGMQLWGENRITLEPTLTDEYGISTLQRVKPTVLALYGKSMDSVMTFWSSIPRENDPTAPICYDYAWPADPSSDFPTTEGHTCLTRLTW